MSYKKHDWEISVYGDTKKPKPEYALEQLRVHVILAYYVDTKIYHDILIGISVTGMIPYNNQTHIDWVSKKQAACEKATHISTYVPSCTCVEKLLTYGIL